MTKRQLTERQMFDIVIRSKENVNKAQLAREFNVHRETIRRRLAVYSDEKRLTRKPGSGRPSLIGAENLEELKNYIASHPFAKLAEIKRDLDLPLSLQRISFYCSKLGLPSRISPKKFYIKPINLELRLAIARERRSWGEETWNNVVFTDESGIDNSGAHQRRVRRPLGARYEQQFIYNHENKTMRVNFFSYISKFGVGTFFTYETMNAEVYQHILPIMISELRKKFGHEDFKIVHDNARFATGFQATQFIAANNYERFFIQHPPYSPDMNLIENAWALLKRIVKNKIFEFGQERVREKFIKDISDAWKSIPVQTITNLYKSLPRRMEEIIKQEGRLTKY